MKENEVFGRYSDFYDLLYYDKDYKREADYVWSMMEKHLGKSPDTILSLGCGTCNHEVLLSDRVKQIVGIERSEGMIIFAADKIQRKGISNIKLIKGDIRNIDVQETFDCAMAMFNVIGYLTSDEDFDSMLESVACILRPGGLLVFDCWHGLAVIKDGPTKRQKEITFNDRQLRRYTVSQLDTKRDLVEINFQIVEEAGKSPMVHCNETHVMRYRFLPQTNETLLNKGFEIAGIYNFLDQTPGISDDRWDIFFVARKMA